ncbi:TetR/AcrR family transcriptional regulator [Methylophaga sp. OBS4]|uniref:TetR/AcrR family transcriptional regulator n=1 Tax=Methylophaga sp. OBS4 TaxID=2991935 RepID=UPI00225406AB|nr:TetR/AcrR family transcriptional regulator [Methylophaga sp. OBS4]MCX4188263.1 TetR/AcrR family transcriptional regulator [Methylophaga sp. OBS4]
MNQAIRSRFSDTRQQILNTAQDIILGKGFAAVGLNEILKTAQVPKGSFYHYFESKEQFGNALLENYFDQYMITLDESLHNDGSPALQRLLTYFEHWKSNQCNDTTRDKCLVVKLSGEVTDLSETMRQTLKQGTQRVINRLAECVQEAIDNDEISINDDAETVTQEIYYLWIGATLLTKVNHNPDALHVAMNALRARLNLPGCQAT